MERARNHQLSTKISNHEEQKRIEREVFDRFCEASGLAYLSGSLRQPLPPAPDILVFIEGLGDVHFELTDISPEAEIRRRNVLHRTSDAFLDCLDELPVETQQIFDAKYSNAIIFPSMIGLRGDRDLRKHAPDVLRTLLALPDGFEGSVAEAGIDLPPATISLCVYRTDHIHGPAFNSIGASLLPRINIAALSNKFSKTYTVSGRCELLAWIGDGGIFHEEDKHEIPGVIASAIGNSPFDRVWLYEPASGYVQQFGRN